MSKNQVFLGWETPFYIAICVLQPQGSTEPHKLGSHEYPHWELFWDPVLKAATLPPSKWFNFETDFLLKLKDFKFFFFIFLLLWLTNCFKLQNEIAIPYVKTIFNSEFSDCEWNAKQLEKVS